MVPPLTPIPSPAPDPAPEQPAPEPPAPSAPEAPAPGVPEQPAPHSEDDTDWLPILLIVGGILLAIVVIAAVAGRKKKSGGTAPPSPQSNLLSTSQWVHDQLSLELMAAPPAAGLQRWSTERSRLDDVAVGAQQLSAEGQDANWQLLGQTMSALASAIETNLQLRAQHPPNAQLINESTDVVNRQRASLQQLITVLRPTVER